MSDGPRIVFDEAPERPWLKWVLGIGAVVLLIVLGVVTYRWALLSAGGDWRRARAEQQSLSEARASLSTRVKTLEKENRALREQVAFLEQSRTIDEQACKDVRESLVEMQATLAESREQVAFYRGIVSPEDAKAGVRVQSLELRPLEPSTVLAYKLVLIQAMRHDRAVSGTVALMLQGLLDGSPTELAWSTLEIGDDVERGRASPYNFKYFQELVGQIALPNDFVPTRLTVTLNPKRRGAKSVTRQYEWGDIVAKQACEPAAGN